MDPQFVSDIKRLFAVATDPDNPPKENLLYVYHWVRYQWAMLDEEKARRTRIKFAEKLNNAERIMKFRKELQKL